MTRETLDRQEVLLKGSDFENPAQLATAAGISRGVMSGIVRGIHWPQRKTRERLCAVLNISEQELKRRLAG